MESKMNRPQSLAGYIRQNLPELETRLEFGVRQDVLVAELGALGYTTTLKGFRNFLRRARLRAAEMKASGVQMALPASNPAALNASSIHAAPPNLDDPLTKSKGFEFNGTSAFDVGDLI